MRPLIKKTAGAVIAWPHSVSFTLPRVRLHVQASRYQKRARKLYRTHKKGLRPFGLSLSIVVLAQIALLIKPQLGAYATAAAIIALAAAAARKPKFQLLLTATCVLPVVMLASLAVPVSTPLWQAAAFYGPLVVLAGVYRWLFAREKPLALPTVFWKAYVAALPSFVILGQALAAIAYMLLRHQHLFGHAALWKLLLIAPVFAAAEELFFRGLVQPRAAQVMRPGLAAVLTTLLYTAASLPLGNLPVTVFAATAGTALSLAYYAKQSVLLTAAANLTMRVVFIGLLATLS